MKLVIRAAAAAVCAVAAQCVAAAELPAPFRALSFEAASELAAKEQKLVFVDFYTTWCEPCKRLDAQTFSNPEVAALIGANAVAIKLDAEKDGKAAAQRFKVSAYPTLLVAKADGMEVDRIVGFLEPAAFAREFKSVVAMAGAGKTGLDAARERVGQHAAVSAVTGIVGARVVGEDEEAQPHFDLAKKLIVAGKHAEALGELLWCWDEGKKDPDFARLRSTNVARELGRLAREYPPAREAMIARRDEARERALANKGGTAVVQDLIQLNRELKMDEDTIAVFDEMPEGDRRKVSISIYLFDVFLEKQRYKDAVLFNMPETTFMTIERAKAQAKAGDERGASLVRFTIVSTAKRVEALAGAGLDQQARELGARLLTLDSSEETKALLQRHAARAGKPELFAASAP